MVRFRSVAHPPHTSKGAGRDDCLVVPSWVAVLRRTLVTTRTEVGGFVERRWVLLRLDTCGAPLMWARVVEQANNQDVLTYHPCGEKVRKTRSLGQKGRFTGYSDKQSCLWENQGKDGCGRHLRSSAYRP